jgi:hypothetical protein
VGLLQRILHLGASKSPQPKYIEKRRSPRYLVQRPMHVYSTDRPMQATLMDVSLNGARIRTRFPRECGSRLSLDINVEGRIMTLPGKIVWDRFVEGGGWEFGVDFMQLTEEESAHLERFVDAQARAACATQRLAV